MNCTQCKEPGADCIAKDGTRLCQTCLYERVSDERDDLQFMLEGFVAHGVHTEESRKLADTLGLREGKHTEASTCKIARKEIEKLRRERDKAQAEVKKIQAVFHDGADDGRWRPGETAVDALIREHAEARAEVEQLRQYIAASREILSAACAVIVSRDDA